MVKKTLNWLKVSILLLDEVLVLVIILLLMHFFGVRLPVWVIVVISILIFVVVFLIHLAIMPLINKKPITGQEVMIGMQCRVIEPLMPRGTVFLLGEYWQAESISEDIPADSTVEIIGCNGLILKVKRN